MKQVHLNVDLPILYFFFAELTLVTHISLSLNVDFEKKVLSGFAVLSIDILKDSNQVVRKL